jgi:RimJ/RimL family protein N-acetyltransferase
MVESDAELVVSWRNEPVARSMFFSNEKLSLDNHLDWFRGPRHYRADYVICESHHGRPIGVVNFKNINQLAGSAEAGKLLGDKMFSGKGFAKEAFAAWLLYGFDALNLNYIFVFTRSDNVSSIRINLNLGFKVVGVENNSPPLREGFIKMEISSEEVSLIRQIVCRG